MRLLPDGTFERTDIWREGKYLDLWSVPHFLSGIVVGLGLYLLDFDTRSAIVIALLLLVMWEMFEMITEMGETWWNRTLDVVVGMSSCVPAFLLASSITMTEVVSAFMVVSVLDGFLSSLGWQASAKAFAIEKKLRAEYQREKEKFKKRREALKVQWRNRKMRRKNRRLEGVQPKDAQPELK